MLQCEFLVVYVGVVVCCERYVVLSAMFVYLSMVTGCDGRSDMTKPRLDLARQNQRIQCLPFLPHV